MIKLVDAGARNGFLSYCAFKPFGIKIAGAFRSYGAGYPFADFWAVYEDGNITGAVSRLGGALTLICEHVNGELADFVRSMGTERITGEERTVNELLKMLDSFEPHGSGCIMEHRKFRDELSYDGLILDFEPSAFEFCKLLASSEGKSIQLGRFDDFYADVSHRIRHGTALNVVGMLNNEAISTASAVAITDGGAFIGAVSVREDMRRRSFGYKTVYGLLQKLKSEKLTDENKKAYLLRVDGENKEFYEKLGFCDVGRWAEAKVRR